VSDDNVVDLGAFDRDGAVREASDALRTRGQLLAAAGALATGLVVPAAARGAGRRAVALSREVLAVLTFLHSLEQLQDAFYSEAERLGALSTPRLAVATALGGVERAHAQAFRELLGRRAAARPSFDFAGATEDDAAFLRTAVALEDLTVAAYKEQVPRIASPEALQAGIGIHSVEARHAAWVRRLADAVPAPAALDGPRTRAEALRAVAAAGVRARRRPRTDARSRPTFTR
jgi:hypothetical protein